ncbi:hypothetical protein ORI89_07040 [Sphingobacterium sp. UT-1RO-CII-1]|uniref:hypothetical protein n=1 Tax=Sphingobacterium sp. UT-1RO-CII-1 TaxID=2995225 RepID=UPI00227C3ED5|nr:hypothetical protein [Sphingobacterium sp. UT-1RO-CII-1]MCY4779399.1 hypothetical protein [Sphingobacterium sp. UT-1RO-CII-1]
MRKIILPIVLFGLCVSFYVHNHMKVRSVFRDAEKAFQYKNYSQALIYANEAEKILGQWTLFTSYLKIQCLYALSDMNNFESVHVQSLYEETNKYIKQIDILQIDHVSTGDRNLIYTIKKKFRAMKIEERHAPGFFEAKKAYDTKDYYLAVSLWQTLAHKGNTWAMRHLGLLYRSIRKTKQSEYWYHKAVENGNLQAMHDLQTFDSRQGLAFLTQSSSIMLDTLRGGQIEINQFRSRNSNSISMREQKNTFNILLKKTLNF